MKDNDKNLNQIWNDNVEENNIMEIPLKKLHHYIDFIASADLESVNIILTHKGKWKYAIMSSIDFLVLIGTLEDDEIMIDPRLVMLPTTVKAVPVSSIITFMLDVAEEHIEMGTNIINKVNYLVEYGGGKLEKSS